MKNPYIWLVLALAYFATGRLGLMLPAFGSHITTIWLPTGIAVAALLRWGFGCWPGIALGALAVNITTGAPWPVALGIAAGNTLAPLLSAWALRKMRFHPVLDRSRDFLVLAAGAVLGMLVSSGLGVAILSGAGMLPPGERIQAWLTWWGGDAFGVIAAAPLVLTFTMAEARATLHRRAEFLIWLVATGLVMWSVFGANRGAPGQALAIAFTPLLLVAWAALRFGPAGTSFALIILSVGATYGTATQGGPFYRADPIREMQLLWIFMATSAALGWLISALHTAHVKTTDTQQLFEQALTEVSLGVLLAGLDRRITYANQGFTRLTGYPVAELLGKSCALLQGPETDPETVKKLKAALHGNGFFEGEILNYRKDGTTFWNALLISPAHDESGVKTGFLGIQRNITERKQAELALQQSEEHLRTIIELEPECVKMVSPEGRLIEMNPAGLAMIDAGSLDEVRGCMIADLIVPEDRATFSGLHRQAMQGGSGRCEFAVVSLKGTRRWLETHAVPYRNERREIIGLLGITRDITERKRHEAQVSGQKQVLEMIAAGEALPVVLTALLRFIEAQSPEMLCSLLLLDRDGIHVRHGAAPSLPEEFARAFDGQPIGPQAGSCGTAAFRREPVIVEDIATDPLWSEYRALALPHGLRACWSTPIFDAQRNVLGTFAIYYRQPGRPTAQHQRLIEIGTQTAAIALAREHAQAALREAEARLRLSVTASNIGLWDWNIVAGEIYFSREWKSQLGYAEDEIPNRFEEWESRLHPEDLAPTQAKLQRFIEDPGAHYETELRLRHRDGSYRWIFSQAQIFRDMAAKPVRMLGCHIDITERKRAEEALRESEEKFCKAFRNSPDAVLITTLDGRILEANAGFTRLTGYTVEEARGRTTSELHFWAAAADRERFITALQEHGRVMDLEAPMRTRTGEVHACLVSGELMDLGGKPSIVGTVRDITKRKRSEVALRESEERFRKLIDNAPEATLLLDMGAMQFIQVSAQSERMFKRSAAELLKLGPAELSPPFQPDGRPSGEKAMEYLERTMAGETPVFEWTHRDAEGREFPCEVNLLRMEIGGRPVVRDSVIDITERKWAEAALREREERLRAALSASGAGTFRWDIRTNELIWDEALDALFGLPPGQTIRSLDNFIAAVHPDDRPGVIERCERCARDGADFEMEVRVLWPDGSLHWLDDRGKTFLDDAGKPLHMTGACVDITDRKRDEAAMHDLVRRLMRAEDAERRRIAKELHDSTAQDLVAVMMNLGTLREALMQLDVKRVQVLEDSIALVENSAHDIRTLSYFLHPPRLDEMGLPAALTEYAAGLSRRADIRIRVEVARDFGRLPEEVEVVLFRVAQESLSNAIRHSESDAATVRLTRTDAATVLEIEDFGCGMPQGKAAKTGTYGVGITGMRERVQHLGGRLEVESSATGTIVRAVLPLNRAIK